MANRTPKPITIGPDAVALFWAFVDVSDSGLGCWSWTGYVSRMGYGRMPTAEQGVVFVHRFSYTLAYGPIPPGLTIDHLCRRTTCVRPDHLEAVTQSENSRRMWAPKWPHAVRISLDYPRRQPDLSLALSDLIVVDITPAELHAMAFDARRQYRWRLALAAELGLRVPRAA